MQNITYDLQLFAQRLLYLKINIFSQNVPCILSGIKGPLDRPEITGIEHMQYLICYKYFKLLSYSCPRVKHFKEFSEHVIVVGYTVDSIQGYYCLL